MMITTEVIKVLLNVLSHIDSVEFEGQQKSFIAKQNIMKHHLDNVREYVWRDADIKLQFAI